MSLLNAREFYVDVDGGKLLCIAFGRGEKPLVVIPGLRTASLKGSGAFAAWYYRRFARDYHVYIFDRKEPLPDPCTIRAMAEDTAEAMTALGIRRACVLGASQGGMIAQELAINHPELVERMVLAVTASRVNDTLRDAVETWIDRVRAGDEKGFAEDYIRRGYSEAYLKKYRAFLPLVFKLQKRMPEERFLALARACLTFDARDRLGEIRCPVLVIGGGRDRVVSPEASREIAEKLGCECHMYETLSHEAYNEAKDFNRRVYDFLRG